MIGRLLGMIVRPIPVQMIPGLKAEPVLARLHTCETKINKSCARAENLGHYFRELAAEVRIRMERLERDFSDLKSDRNFMVSEIGELKAKIKEQQ